MHIAWGLTALVEVICLVHVFKTGRPYWWFWVIFVGSLVGCVVYFIVEILPDLQSSRPVKQFRSDFSRLGAESVFLEKPVRRLGELEDELTVSDTLRNRQALAQGQLAAGRCEEAIETYRSCLTGVYADDAALTAELGYALFLVGSYAEAKQALEKVEQIDPTFRPHDRRLLYTRTLEGLDEVDAAIEEYSTLARQYPGEEARCRYAMLLARAGREGEAIRQFEELLATVDRSPGYYRRSQKAWIAIARQNLSK